MKIASALFSAFLMVISFSAKAFDFEGSYSCDDKATLTLQQVQPTFFLAQLIYPDGSASTLVALNLDETYSFGTLYRDDEDAYLGKVQVSGRSLTLKFANGANVTCSK